MNLEKGSINQLEIKYVRQKYDGLEAWVRKGKSQWVRLDFILEYYLSGNVNISKKFKMKNEGESIHFFESLYTKFIQLTCNGENFDFQEYLDWQNSKFSNIEEALKMLNSI